MQTFPVEINDLPEKQTICPTATISDWGSHIQTKRRKGKEDYEERPVQSNSPSL